MVYANIGTIINAIVICILLYALGAINLSPSVSFAEGITFGSLISATDPVTTLVVFDKLQVESNLFGIIVGVSILDDAVAVIIFNLFNGLIGNKVVTELECFYLFLEFIAKFLGSMLVGYLLGNGFSKILQRNSFIQEKIALFFPCLIIFQYFTFFIADVCYLSGIITTLYAGIYFKQTFPLQSTNNSNLQIMIHPYEKIKVGITGVSSLFEMLIFVQIGFSLISHPLISGSDWIFFIWSLLACLVGRAVQIYPLAFLLNSFQSIQSHSLGGFVSVRGEESEHGERRDAPRSNSTCPSCSQGIHLSTGYQHMIFLAGLRGPIAYATSQLFNDAQGHLNMIAGTTGMTVLFTTLIFGALTWPALKWFEIPYVDVHHASSIDRSLHEDAEIEIGLVRKPSSVPRNLREEQEEMISKVLSEENHQIGLEMQILPRGVETGSSSSTSVSAVQTVAADRVRTEFSSIVSVLHSEAQPQ